MIVRFPRFARATLAALALLLALTTGCQSSKPDAPGAQTAGATAPAASGPIRDLAEDESAGGHTLKKHVGRSDEQLRERLERERNISAASTYTDRETAERAVGAALQQEQGKIRRWLERQGGHPNLVLDYDGDPAHPIGRILRRGEAQSEPCSHALVILRWESDGYYVLTSYPECR